MKKDIAIVFLVLLGLSFQTPGKPRIFLVGDSTMANKPRLDLPERGWGQLFPALFSDDVEVVNCAVNGRSTRSFLTEGRWEQTRQQLRQGDWVLIQFGHNDSKVGDTSRYAAPRTAYRQNLIRFINEARNAGANPVLITPVMRRKFDGQGRFQDTHGDYPVVVRELAAEMKVPLIDLHRSSRELIESLGMAESEKLFQTTPPGYNPSLPNGITDNTHFSEYGARQIAAQVAAAADRLHLGFARYLLPFGSTGKHRYDLPVVYEPRFRLDTFDIRNFGAVSDGRTLNTRAISQAIDSCHAHGGGVVRIPAGFWLTGPLRLRDSVNLHLDANALLQFTDDFDQYPLVAGNWEGLPAARNQSPLSASNAVNIAITGNGIIDGNGDAWRMVRKDKLTATQWKQKLASGGVVNDKGDTWYPSEKSLLGSKAEKPGVLLKGKTLNDFQGIKDFLRPNLLVFDRCRNILLEGVTFQNSPAWNLHPLMCRDLTVRNVTVRNPWYAQNGDGIDVESCSRVLIEGSSFDVGDDGICIKSGRDEQGRKRGLPTEDLVAINNVVYHAHGGFVIGSEMSGGARRLYVSNCSFIGTDIGLRFKTTRGRGGVVEQVYVDHINMKDIVGDAIRFDMYYAAKDPVPQAGENREAPEVKSLPVDEGTPVFRDFHISNIYCNGAARALFIRGLPEMPIRQIYMDHLVLTAQTGVESTEADQLTLDHVQLVVPSGEPLFRLDNNRNIILNHIEYTTDAGTFLDITGKRSENINLRNTELPKAADAIRISAGAQKNALQVKTP